MSSRRPKEGILFMEHLAFVRDKERLLPIEEDLLSIKDLLTKEDQRVNREIERESAKCR